MTSKQVKAFIDWIDARIRLAEANLTAQSDESINAEALVEEKAREDLLKEFSVDEDR
jgi:hypothetical protein